MTHETINTEKEFANILNRTHSHVLGDKFFTFQSTSNGSETHVTITLQNNKKTFFYPIEARMQTKSQGVTTIASVDLLVDYINCYLEQYFESGGDVYLPIDWTTFDVEGIALQMRGQILNKYAEDLADALLSGNKIGDFN